MHSYQSSNHPYQYLGGWLGFFHFACIAGAAAIGLTYIWNFWQMIQWWDYLAGLFIVYDIIVVCLGIPVIVKLLSVSSKIRSKDWLFIQDWEFVGIYTVVYEIVVGIIGKLIVKADLITGSRIARIISAIIIFVIWEMYIINSVRVRTFFATDKYIRISKFFSNHYVVKPAVIDDEGEEKGSKPSRENNSDSGMYISRGGLREKDKDGWKCSCGKYNPSYVGTCGCGRTKNTSEGWICYFCNRNNANMIGTCACGKTRQESEDRVRMLKEKHLVHKESKESDSETDKRAFRKNPNLEELQKLNEYKKLLDSGVISDDEFELRKKEVLGKE